jgi:di/tricarboxylate transporter
MLGPNAGAAGWGPRRNRAAAFAYNRLHSRHAHTPSARAGGLLTPAVLSLLALLVAIVLSCVSQLNVGILAMAMAWLIGVLAAGMTADAVAAAFPTQLFVTLAGVTLLFAVADSNGTIEALARRALGLARGSARVVPIVLFLIAMVVSTIGPGAVAAVALVAPVAMALGVRTGMPALLISLMVANGANAGNLSPLSAVGVIANTKMAGVGLGGHEWAVWAANLAAHAAVGAAAWILFGGLRQAGAVVPNARAVEAAPRLTGRQWLTFGVVAAWIAGVVFARWHVGLSAFAAAVLLIVVRAGDETASIRKMPWSAMLMVCGVSVLIGVLERTGGMDLFTGLLARLASPATINGVVAFVMGAISTYSSTSGVVLPTFLPMVPSLVQSVGGGDPLAVALSINVGASLVDVSPLSTIGALCVAALPDAAGARDLFRKLLVWGLSMTVVGAALCQACAALFAAL